MYNPFKEQFTTNESDARIVRRVLNGSRQELEKLITRHQAWIYNIALKMVLDPSDAEDVTQEILIKLITKLSTFDPEKGAFRTWLYRIVANHVLTMKKKRYETFFASFEESAADIEKIPDQTIHGLPESGVLVNELKIKCWTAMLLCLSRKQRLAFILGGIFEVPDTIGSDILETSKANFRKLLSRGRMKIDNFMQQKCGLMHPDNPCSCERKLKAFIENGFVRPDHIGFFRNDVPRITDLVHDNLPQLERLYASETIRNFQEHPFHTAPDFTHWMSRILDTDLLNRLLGETLQ